ncbi:LacI family transcriptional regulator [Hymenobacter sp. NBH84]|uniref:LacI family DNA-binding transcriptional regulator n=1 Tax=Hymenobacter sp. NBH84 TaxID=2596915 RepID=UPI001629DB4E|nr:LacI family DNA-binding transcriptional regulator [Hymenobacter sp. NBH84]QNE39874.1 LacI family transcriptional regulator [Hymenobacter sp. NBH84]
MNPVNLKQLAQELNLSVSTVSRALSDSYEISATTKAKVQQLARQLGYEPNPYASSLRRQKSKTIGVVIPEVANNFFSLAINGIEEVARENNYHVLIYLTHDDAQQEATIVQHFASGRVDGILASLAGETQDFSHFSKLQERHIPMVFFDRVCEEFATAKITTDDYRSGYQATQHLLDTGCRHIAHLLISDHLSIGQKRLQGYLDALQAHGLTPDPALLLRGTSNKDRNQTLIQELLQQNSAIDGIFASVETLAMSSYLACRHLGRRIPEDVKIISFSNLEIADLLDPPLTTIAQPAYEMGREAARILFKSILKNRPILPTQSQELKSTLIQRKSTATT